MPPDKHTSFRVDGRLIAVETTENDSVEDVEEIQLTNNDIRLLHSLRLAPGELSLFSSMATSIPLLNESPQEEAKLGPLVTMATENGQCAVDVNKKLHRDFEELINYNNAL